MRVVTDTNTVVSGLLWHGKPRQVLDAARAGRIQLFTTANLLLEMKEVLERDKFAERLRLAGVASYQLVNGYSALARVVQPATIPPVITADPDDDQVLACAKASEAEIIVSGDAHLLEMEEYEGIEILTAAEMLVRLARMPSGEPEF
jgi:putative PIN family toxin of toxin-antitoxin system